MTVMINDINVKNLGPISNDINWELGKLNLIYGKNETGKTFLVEFLIRSLFQPKEWKLRPPMGTGKINITGLDDKTVSFSPSSSMKFDDYYENVIGGLPPDFSKLLIVKGANVDLNDGEVDKIFIKRYLSSKEILDTIEEKIVPTIRNATIEDNQIVADRRGDIQRRLKLQNKLGSIDDLFMEVNRDYLGGDRKILENKLKVKQETLFEMEKAKRHLAYTLEKQIEELESKQEEIDDETIEDLGKRLNDFEQNQPKFKTKQKEYESLKEEGKEYSWVKNSADTYEKFLSQTNIFNPNKILFLPLVCFIGLMVVFSQIDLIIGVIASALGVLGILYLIIREYQIIIKSGGKTKEMEKIYEEFEKRFGKTLSGLPQLKTLSEELKTAYDNSVMLKKQLGEEESELKQSQGQLSRDFKRIFGKDLEPQNWDESLQSVKKEKKERDKKIREFEQQLSRLDVEKEEYLEEPASLEYNNDKYSKLKDDEFNLDKEMKNLESDLDNLKSNICRITGDDINIGLPTLIEHLRNEHDETLKEFKDITANIVGKIAVIDALKEFREAEDEKIQQSLQSDVISKPLNEVTNKYIGVKLEDDCLYVNDSYNDFRLDEISSGAREQVLLALRMGFCARILNKDKLFLILDDAFQYSDWNRRKLLINKVVDLAKNGWQILYFTMDDNIKDLFDTIGNILGDDYKKFVLAES